MSSKFAATLVAGFLMLAGNLAHAVDIAGVHVDERAQVGDSKLELNGAGLRKFIFFKVYVAALYTVKKTASASEVIDSSQPRRIVMVMKRDLDADELINALREGLEANNSAAELATLKPGIDQFEGIMRNVGDAKEGDNIVLDFTADATSVGFNGKPYGSVSGAAFGRALLKVWLGDKPVQSDLKQAMLGG
jgi:Chalcone isomerase-like